MKVVRMKVVRARGRRRPRLVTVFLVALSLGTMEAPNAGGVGWGGRMAPLVGCGYRAQNARIDPLGPFVVQAGARRGTDASAFQQAIAAASASVAASGNLSSSADGDVATIEIEILRIDEQADAIAASNGAPRARSVRIRMVGRARVWLGGRMQRDTGDVAVVESVSTAAVDAPTFDVARQGARAAAGRKLGRVVVERLLWQSG